MSAVDYRRQVKADLIDLFFFVPLRNGGEVEGELLVMIDVAVSKRLLRVDRQEVWRVNLVASWTKGALARFFATHMYVW